MTPDSSSDVTSTKDRVANTLLRFLEPIWLSYELTSHSHAPTGHTCQSTGDSWTILPDLPFHATSATNIEWQDSQSLNEEVESVIALATEEFIEDGMDSATAECLRDFVATFSDAGVRHLANYLAADWIKSATVADIVRLLGRLDHEESHDDRLWIASHFLFSDAPVARDASALALEDLNDARALPKLEEAVKAEAIRELKDDLQMALRELKHSTDVHVP